MNNSSRLNEKGRGGYKVVISFSRILIPWSLKGRRRQGSENTRNTGTHGISTKFEYIELLRTSGALPNVSPLILLHFQRYDTEITYGNVFFY